MCNKIINSTIHQLAFVMVIAGISAIMFTKSLTELLLDELPPIIMLGLSIIIICLIPIIAHKSIPDPKFIYVFLFGIFLVGYGFILG